MGSGKAQAKAQAILWWDKSRRSSAECDKCNADIKWHDGFLCKPLFIGPADLLCEACFDASPSAEALVGVVPTDRSDSSTFISYAPDEAVLLGGQKELARSQAILWWDKSGRSSAECDKCNADIRRHDGFLCKPLFLGPADLLCEACFDASPTAEAFAGVVPGARSDPATFIPNAPIDRPGAADPVTPRSVPWAFILFLLAFVLSFSAWTGAIYRAVFHWQGLISEIQLLFGLTLLGQAVLLALDLWRENPRAMARGMLYALTLLIYFIFLLITTGATVGTWLGMLAFWVVIVLMMLNHVSDVAEK